MESVKLLIPQPPQTAGSDHKCLTSGQTSRSHVSERTSVTKNPAGANLFSRFMKTSTSANVRAMLPLAETQVPRDASPRRQIGILCRNLPPTERVEILNTVIPSIRCPKASDDKVEQKDLLHGNPVYDYRSARAKLTEAEMLESMRPLVAVTFYEQNSKAGTRGKDFKRLVVPNQIDIRNTLAVQEATFKRSLQKRSKHLDSTKDQDDWDKDSEKAFQSPPNQRGGNGKEKASEAKTAAATEAESAKRQQFPDDRTSCGTARFVVQQLDQFESNVFGGRVAGQRPKRKQQQQQQQSQQHADGSGGSSGGGFALDYMCANPFASASGSVQQQQQQQQNVYQLVHYLSMYQQVTQMLDSRSPTQRLNIRRSVLQHFPTLLADALELRGRPTIHIAEFLTLFLTPEVIPFRSDIPVAAGEQYFSLPARPSFSVHHIGRLAEGHPIPAEENLLLPAIQVPQDVLDSVQAWEALFLVHDTTKSSRANKYLLLLNMAAATCDAVIMQPEGLKNASRDLSRVRTAVGWLSVLLLQRAHTDTVRPGELFAIRDFLKGEIEREKLDRKILVSAYFGSQTGGSGTELATLKTAGGSSGPGSARGLAGSSSPIGSPRMKPTAHFFPSIRFENALEQLEAGTRQMIAAREQLPPAAAASLLQECFCLQP
jgi:hypothetical protein